MNYLGSPFKILRMLGFTGLRWRERGYACKDRRVGDTEELSKLGGGPDKCRVYELMLFHLAEDDKEPMEVYKDCVGGTRVCGNCKKYTAELMREFLKEHQEKREMARERLGEYGL